MKFSSKKKSKPVTESVDQECDYVFTEDSKFDFEKAIRGTDYVKNLRKVDILNAKLKNKKITQEQFDKEYAKISTVNANGFVMTIPKNGSEGRKPKVVRPNKDKPGDSFKEIKKGSNDKSSYNGNIKSKSDAEKFDHYNNILRRTEDYREYKDAFKNMARLLGNPNACTIKITPNSRGGKINGESFNSKQSAGCSSSDKLYHTSNQKGITRLTGKFRGHEGFYFSSKRVYFHKNNPGSINTSSNSDYIAKDGEYVYQFMGNPSSAFVDPEIKGSAVFIETDTSIPVKDVTDQFKKKSKPVQESAESDYSYSYLKDSDIPEFYDSFEKTFHTRDCGLNKSEIKKGMQAIKFDNKVIGYIGFSYYNEKGKKYMGIGNFMIKPEYQGKGHGTNVIADIIEKNKDKYDEIYCYVDKKNTKAISFYKKIGDVRTNEETKYGYYVTLYRKDKPFEESSRSELPNYKFGIEDKRKFELDTKKHVESAIKLFGHAEESDKKHLAKRIAEEAEKYGIEIPETTQVYKYLHEDCNEDIYDEVFLEAALKDSTILKDSIYPKIEKCLLDPNNVRKLKRIMSDFIERNTDKLTTPGPQYLIVFGDQDKELYYELFEMKKQEVIDSMKSVIKQTGSNSDFKYLLGNPFLAILYYTIRFFTLHKDVKALNATLGMFAIDVYWSIFTKYFPNGVIEAVMQYTIDNLTDKFIIKRAGTIFGALMESAKRSYTFHEQKIRSGNDAECVSFMQRIRNDQNSMFRTLSSIYYKNHKEGRSIATRNDDYDPNNPILDDVHTSSTEIQSVVDKSCMPMISNGIDIALAEAAARMSNISISTLRVYLTKIFVTERLEEITSLVESMIFLYINGEHKSARDIKSQYFLYWSAALFKKTNSKDGNIININAILDKWGNETGIYQAFKSEGSRINYKKAIFLYIAMSIQKYT